MTTLHASVVSLQNDYIRAVDRKDPDAFLELFAPDARVFDAWAIFSCETTDERQASIRHWLGSLDPGERVRVVFGDTRVFEFEDNACVTSIVTYAAIDTTGKEIRSMQNRLTWLVAERDGRPRILHEHTSVPIGDDLKAILKRA